MNSWQQQIVGIAICALIAFVAALAASVFLCLGLYLWLAVYIPAGWAAVLTAAIIVVAASITIVVVRMITTSPAPAPQPASSTQGDWATQLGLLFGGQAQDFARKNPTTTVLGSLALGFAIGASPKLRNAIRKAFFG